MFTGIVQTLGRIASSTERGGDLRLGVEAGGLDLSRCALGDSIAVNGVCLTAVEIDTHGFVADVSRETLDKTGLGELAAGSPVNLEPALRADGALGGHLVSGHVDGVGRLLDIRPDARSERYRFEIDPALQHYIASKGSVTVDGVSLTVNGVDGNRFDVNIVPHTRQRTLFGHYAPGARVNIEVDIVARYLERLLLGRAGDHGEGDRKLRETLIRSGFLDSAKDH